MIAIRLFFLIAIVALLAVVHLFQWATLLLLPFSRDLFRRSNGALAACWWALLTLGLEHLCGLRVQVISNALPSLHLKSALLIANHQSLIDALVILMIAKRVKALEYLKWFVKDSLIYVPFLGMGLWFLDSIFLRRKWDQDQSKIASSFSRMKGHQDPLWLVSFVEGTRRNPKRLKESRDFALKNQEVPFKNTLFPRYKGFSSVIQGLGDRIEVIHSLTIRYKSPEPSLMRLLKGDLGEVHVLFETIEVKNVSQSTGARDWLIQEFRKKDLFLESTHGSA